MRLVAVIRVAHDPGHAASVTMRKEQLRGLRMSDAGTRAKCPKCGAGLRVAKELVGRSVRCAKCHAALRVGAGSGSQAPIGPPALAQSAFANLDLPPRKPAPARRFGIGIGLVVLALAAVVGGVFWAIRPVPQPKRHIDNHASPIVVEPPAPRPTFPPLRRILAVAAYGYLYANPVRPGSPPKNVETLLDRLAERWEANKDQTILLSDVANHRAVNSPTKAVVETAVSSFLTVARDQDTAVVLIVGHATTIEGKPYFVPLDGEVSRPATLIELAWLFDRLRECRARQRLLIVDVCRQDPDRPAIRPSPAPMTEALEAALKSPPPGVQVWSACSAGQTSMECDDVEFENNAIEGGVFLNQFFRTFLRGTLRPLTSDDVLPLDGLVPAVNDFTQRFAKGARGIRQVPFLAGSVDATRLAAPPVNESPRVFHMPTDREFHDGGTADTALIRAIDGEIRVPSIRPGAADLRDLPVSYSAKALDGYLSDSAASQALSDGVRHAIGVLRRHGEGVVVVNGVRKSIGADRKRLVPPVNDALKRRILKEQAEGPGLLFAELEAELAALQKLALVRQTESSPRWQAHYDFVTAATKARIAHINEYNFMLGKVRKDELPPLTPKVHSGWRLAPIEKLSAPRDVKDLADEARQAFDRLIRERPGTPWEVRARRERVTFLGLQWQPAVILP